VQSAEPITSKVSENACQTNNIFIREVYILGIVKRNPLFLHEIKWKNNGFLFITPNILY